MMGMFYPFDKGLNPIKNGTPWVIQGAFISSVFYHLMVNDKTGPLGKGFRTVLGEYTDGNARVFIAILWFVCQSLQVIRLFL